MTIVSMRDMTYADFLQHPPEPTTEGECLHCHIPARWIVLSVPAAAVRVCARHLGMIRHAQVSGYPNDRPCAVCGRELSDAESHRLDEDTDFVEHHGHRIARLPRQRVASSSGGHLKVSR